MLEFKYRNWLCSLPEAHLMHSQFVPSVTEECFDTNITQTNPGFGSLTSSPKMQFLPALMFSMIQVRLSTWASGIKIGEPHSKNRAIFLDKRLLRVAPDSHAAYDHFGKVGWLPFWAALRYVEVGKVSVW
jgi:hypothetical protein